MKNSSAAAPRPRIDRPTAWACTLTNAVTLPGLGTIAGGSKLGYVQAALALVGFVLSALGLVAHVRVWIDRGELPQEFTGGLVLALAGLALFATAWLWALGSSIRLHRQAARPPVLTESHDTAAPPTRSPS